MKSEYGKAERFPFVVVEGIDGVGKSTIAKLVATKLSGEYYKTPSAPYTSIRAAIDLRGDPLSRYYFYLSSVCLAAREISGILNHRPVVCDRYLYSTYAYHFTMDANLRQCALRLPILMPDLAVLLIVDEKDRLARLNGRGDPPEQCPAANERNTAFLRKVEAEFRGMPLKVIETTSRSPETIAADLVAELESCFGIGRKPAEIENEHECAAST